MRWPRVLFIAIAVLSLAHSVAAQGEPHVDVLEVEGPITPSRSATSGGGSR